MLPYTALCITGFIDPSVDVFQLLIELGNVKEALKRILAENWPDWGKIRAPLLPKEIPVPKALLSPQMIVKPQAQQTLRNEIKPYIERIDSMCNEAEETLHKVSVDYPKILELCELSIKTFKRLFRTSKIY